MKTTGLLIEQEISPLAKEDLICVSNHLADCAKCSGRAKALQDALEGLAAIGGARIAPRQAARESFLAQVRGLREEVPAPDASASRVRFRSRLRRAGARTGAWRVALIGSVAATMALVAGVWLLFQPRGATRRSPPLLPAVQSDRADSLPSANERESEGSAAAEPANAPEPDEAVPGNETASTGGDDSEESPEDSGETQTVRETVAASDGDPAERRRFEMARAGLWDDERSNSARTTLAGIPMPEPASEGETAPPEDGDDGPDPGSKEKGGKAGPAVAEGPKPGSKDEKPGGPKAGGNKGSKPGAGGPKAGGDKGPKPGAGGSKGGTGKGGASGGGTGGGKKTGGAGTGKGTGGGGGGAKK